MLPSVKVMENYIRQAAIARGIDPDVAVRVARSEGLGEGVWQANTMLKYGRERSYGPFQLHVAPEGFSPGLGNAMQKETGLDPADPRNWKQGIDYALKAAAQGGWGPWYGAKKIGITGKAGIGGQTAQAAPPPVPVREDRGGPYNSGYGAADPAGLLDAPSLSQEGWGELGKMGLAMLKKAEADEELPEEQQQWLQPAVMAPLRRVTLKGLLG